MAAPQVQSLAEIMAELSAGSASSTNVLNEQRAGLGAKYDIQRQGLTAEKGQGFNAINNQATGRGLSFSGIPLDEQATYLSTKYLPAYAQTFQQQNDEDLAIRKDMAAIDRENNSSAINVRGQQQSALNSWNLQMEQQNFQREQNDLDRKARAAEAAASRAASSAANAAPTPAQFLAQQFASNLDDDNRKNGWTENILAGTYASAYGLSRKDALAQIYTFRQQYYGF